MRVPFAADTSDTFHFPPEVLEVTVDAIGNLVKGKKDVLTFFRGAGVPHEALAQGDSILALGDSKFKIARGVLTSLNERMGNDYLRARREVLKRICEWEDFSTCWPNCRERAELSVTRLRNLVNIKDTFTRLNDERERERLERGRQYEHEKLGRRAKLEELRGIRADLFALFSEKDAALRGKALEGVLNRLFSAAGILIREAFILKGKAAEGIIEQIDGVIDLDGTLYFVEMKWHKTAIGVNEIGPAVVRVFERSGRGLIVSASSFSEAAVTQVRGLLAQRVIGLCDLEYLVVLLDRDVDLASYLRGQFQRTIMEMDPKFTAP